MEERVRGEGGRQGSREKEVVLVKQQGGMEDLVRSGPGGVEEEELEKQVLSSTIGRIEIWRMST